MPKLWNLELTFLPQLSSRYYFPFHLSPVLWFYLKRKRYGLFLTVKLKSYKMQNSWLKELLNLAWNSFFGNWPPFSVMEFLIASSFSLMFPISFFISSVSLTKKIRKHQKSVFNLSAEIISYHWIRLSVIWRIMQISEGVMRLFLPY